MDKNKTIDKERKVACLECDTETYHKVIHSVNTFDSGDWGVAWNDYEIIICQGCRAVSFRKASGTDDIIGVDEEGKPVYDEHVELFPSRVRGRKKLRYDYDLPPNIRKIYDETHKAISGGQPILAGIGIRTLVEAVCMEKNTTGKNLEEKIDSLVKIGLLTKDGAEILHKTRIYGNEAAHKTIPIKDEDLGILMDIAENLLENAYILPKKANALEKRRAQSTKST